MKCIIDLKRLSETRPQWPDGDRRRDSCNPLIRKYAHQSVTTKVHNFSVNIWLHVLIEIFLIAAFCADAIERPNVVVTRQNKRSILLLEENLSKIG